MESGVKHGHHGNVAHNSLAGVDAGDVCGIVKGSKRSALLQCFHDLVGDEHGGGKFLAAVDDAVTDSVDLLHGADNAVFGRGELVNDCGNGLGMSGESNVLVEHGFVADQRSVLQMAVDADTLAEAFGQKLLIVHIDELILEGGAACVDNKNFHYLFPFSCKLQ